MKAARAFFGWYFVIMVCFVIPACGKKDAGTDQKISPKPAQAPEPAKKKTPVDRITLTNGGIIEGKIVEESPTMVRINWQGGIVGFSRAEIQSVEHAVSADSKTVTKDGVFVPAFESENQKKNSWPKGARHRVLLKNGEVVGGEIAQKTDQAFTVRQKLDEGGQVTLELPLERVEQIDLWQPQSGEPRSDANLPNGPPKLDSEDRFEALKKQFLGLKMIETDRIAF